DAFRPSAEDRVIEIGPGDGALTRRLIDRVGRLRAVEVDPALAGRLERDLNLAGGGKAAIVRGDILDIDLAALLDDVGSVPGRPARVIANLPYNIASAVILRLLPESHRLRDLLLMVQREVAGRIAAAPRSRAYGSLSVLCQTAAHIDSVLRLGPGSFRPRPRVDSEVIHLRLKHPPPIDGPGRHALSALLRVAFAHRRKTIQNNLAASVGHLAAGRLITEAGLSPGMRPEEIAVEQFVVLSRLWTERRDGGRP
ncbi:MAG TPA: 16S rRNA (adenine(1518)-N(6)/adenine(1519)-N(6))-dimethyltransferase RsmA, partial [Candidatus Polarisedimenticolia bacterium]|nr:16S rRNA (adenine(1518)-N(6)/adenine(1519)-N(6))-dimethyltransferase RsmA [Candidatus Polarisedimenticolia bacterium]